MRPDTMSTDEANVLAPAPVTRSLDCSKCQRATEHAFAGAIPSRFSRLERWNCAACRRDRLVDGGPLADAVHPEPSIGIDEAAMRALERLAAYDHGEAPLPTVIVTRLRAVRDMSPSEPEDRTSRREVRRLARPFVPDADIDGSIDLDGGDITITPASDGLALFSLREHGHGTAVVRVNRTHLDEIITQLTAARDALPEVRRRVAAMHADRTVPPLVCDCGHALADHRLAFVAPLPPGEYPLPCSRCACPALMVLDAEIAASGDGDE